MAFCLGFMAWRKEVLIELRATKIIRVTIEAGLYKVILLRPEGLDRVVKAAFSSLLKCSGKTSE